MAKIHYHLSDESDQDSSTTATHIFILLQFLLKNQIIDPYLTIMWDHTYGSAKHYRCTSAIYLPSCLAL